jgi:hypothetical protein
MSVWLSETEFRQSDAAASGVTLNVAFLREIKEDHFSVREQANQIFLRFKQGMTPREAVDWLSSYRDTLETYFALEKCYGYFNNAQITNPVISKRATELQDEHEVLFSDINQLIELTEQIVYRECGPELTLAEISDLFECFASRFEIHEQHEMELMLRLCNEEFGVGD